MSELPSTPVITIGDRTVGEGHPTYVIAEIGFNHGGDMGLAREMVEAAADAGADAVKFQTFQASDLALETAPHFELVRSGEMSPDEHAMLRDLADKRGVDFLSTPFSVASANLLAELGVPAFKVASMDATNLPFLRHLADKGRPLLISTGMATLDELRTSIEALGGAVPVCLLHCISEYPTPPEKACLRALDDLRALAAGPLGYSDHTLGLAVPLAAVARGACLVEKHFTTDKSLDGPDHAMSADPAELRAMVEMIRAVEAAMGIGGCASGAEETRPDRGNAAAFRRGLYATRDLAAGEILTEDMLKAVRPEAAYGPADLSGLVGRPLKTAVARNTPLSPLDIAE